MLSPQHIAPELAQRALEVKHQPIHLPNCSAAGVEVLLRRDDILPGGNKFYKLHFNLLAARESGCDTLVSMGGAHSNHLHALGIAAQEQGFKLRVLVRGYAHMAITPTLADLKAAGAIIEFVGHSEYRELCQAGYIRLNPNEYFLPEGGANAHGEEGARYIGWAIEQHFGTGVSDVVMAAGTGSTLKGVTQGLNGCAGALGVSVLKGAAGSSLYRNGCGHQPGWKMLWGFCGKGYGRPLAAPMLAFWREFEYNNGVLIDPVYTLKMLWALNQLARLGYWRQGARIVAVHTGGLQGRRGFKQQPETTINNTAALCAV
ncbi:1-aminocyclopropane-1-carboxylate deaminase/D-cysteine desulfhydrase [Gilvimarinus agarilyticus]|uniref:1-aminocyclopropane-1-carboxylate deaminase/D-cysteine desulfhydrase n=1 Tax=Gilvimarinus agarilyticus TaxID=679259 RepID=UPI00059FBE6B|nr:pyridoxal-phosphate dependent enzyme [Gilvimarinus agarilyticus]